MFVFNFHPVQSFSDYIIGAVGGGEGAACAAGPRACVLPPCVGFIALARAGVPVSGDYRLILSSDDAEFGGHRRIDRSVSYPSLPEYSNRPFFIKVREGRGALCARTRWRVNDGVHMRRFTPRRVRFSSSRP